MTVPGRGAQRRAPGLPEPGRCLVMGVVNVTPDSFSDGGAWLEPAAAVAHGLRLVAEGADLVDVGRRVDPPGRAAGWTSRRNCAGSARSSPSWPRPGSWSAWTPCGRPWPRPRSEAGARLVNDVSGGLADPAMPRLVAGAGVPYVVMHWRGSAATCRTAPSTRTWCARSATNWGAGWTR